MQGVARAAVMTAVGEGLRLVEYPLPRVPEGGVLVRVACCTICKSDLHTWTGRRPGPLPAILGHEIVGRVVELGGGVRSDSAGQPLAIGDRVTWTLHSCCGACRNCCERRLPMKCLKLRKYGHDACDQPPHLQGGLAEYCLVDAGTGLLKLPDGVSDLAAAPANCATATAVAAWEAAEFARGDTVLIQGAGALGCYAAALAAFGGASRVIVADIDAARLETVRRFGATDCLDVRGLGAMEVAEEVRRLTQSDGVDCALELAGVPSAVGPGLASLRVGGRYVEVGCVFPGARVELDLSNLLRNRLTLRGLHNYDFPHLQKAVELLASAGDRFPFESVVGASYPLQRVNEALHAAEAGEAMRVAVTFD